MIVSRPREVVWHVRHDHARMEQQRCLEPQGCLVMQQVFPPVRRHVLRDYNHDSFLRVAFVQGIDVAQQWPSERAIRRFDDKVRSTLR